MISPIEDLKAQVEVQLNTLAPGAEHLLGKKELANNSSYPRFIWVPTTGTPEQGKLTQSPVTEERQIGDTREMVDVHCHGANYSQAYALRHNLLVAVNAIEAVQAGFEGSKWSEDAWLQDGQCLVVTLWLRVPTLDQFIDLTTLDPTGDPSVEITGVDVPSISLTNDLEADGEPLVA